MHPTRLIAAVTAALLSLPLLTGCGTTTTDKGLRAPSLTATFTSIPDDEVDDIRRGMSNAEQTGTSLTYRLPLRLNETFDVEELSQELARWHNQISAIRNAKGTQIAANDGVIISLKYVSSKAESGSTATIFIKPTPSGAKLFLDDYVPGAESNAADGSTQLNSKGEFRVRVPFSFIKDADRIHFRTKYRGSTRYFYYDVASQRQEEVADIANDKEWSEYQQSSRKR